MNSASFDPKYFFILFPVGFALFWMLICQLLSKLSGWKKLAQKYTSTKTSNFNISHFGSCKMGLTNYNNCVKYGSDYMGLFIGVWMIFKMGHPDLYIPYQDIKVGVINGKFLKYVEFQIGAENISMKVLYKTAKKITNASQGMLKIIET